ncbi:hypothetical protein M4578_15140 [Salipiger sp. P9]|uniref:hypothetical protein n=1 Tax=Salipiger pentaromativorans TaxID=2943193 RepID=UPI0021577DAD|nr:hypothetical protein [Salipiger pentaromativorans]MCR8549173.1 hypothetical protein [Salipiger pentaromativorans]
MRIHVLARAGLALALATAVAGCLGNSGSGGGGNGQGAGAGSGGSGSGSAMNFQQNFDRVSAMAPTSNMPTSIQAAYSGKMRADVTDANNVVAQVEGDLDLNVDWTDGQTTNPFTGTASNFTGTLVTGETGTINGTLTVDNSFGGTINRTVNPAMVINGINVPATQIGGLSVTLTGDLTQGGVTADTLITLGGAFFGDKGKAALGPVVGGYKLPNSANPAIFDGAIAGQYYIEAK